MASRRTLEHCRDKAWSRRRSTTCNDFIALEQAVALQRKNNAR
jgi:hypothetical protein